MAGLIASSEEQKSVNQCIKQITGDLSNILMPDQPLQWMLRPVYSKSRFLPRIKPLAKSVAFNFPHYTITHKSIKRAIDDRLREYNIANSPSMVKMIQFIPYAIQLNITGMDNRWIVQVETEEAWKALIRYGIRINDKVVAVRDYIAIQKVEIEIWKILNDKTNEPTRFVTPGSSVAAKTPSAAARKSRASKTPKSLTVTPRSTSLLTPASPNCRRRSFSTPMEDPITAVEAAALESSISSIESSDGEKSSIKDIMLQLWFRKYVEKWLQKIPSRKGRRKFSVKFKDSEDLRKHKFASSNQEFADSRMSHTENVYINTKNKDSKKHSVQFISEKDSHQSAIPGDHNEETICKEKFFPRKLSFGSLACALYGHDSEEEESFENIPQEVLHNDAITDSDGSCDTYDEDPYGGIKRHRKSSFSSCSSVDSPPIYKLLMPPRRVNYRRAFDSTYTGKTRTDKLN